MFVIVTATTEASEHTVGFGRQFGHGSRDVATLHWRAPSAADKLGLARLNVNKRTRSSAGGAEAMYTPLTRPPTPSRGGSTSKGPSGPRSSADRATWEPSVASGRQKSSTAADIIPWEYESCAYCGEDNENYLIECKTCKRWFCNGSTKTGSAHAIMHLRRSGHKTIAAHPRRRLPVVECYVCGSTNIFTMGIVPVECADVLVILCATPCAGLEEFADVTWKEANLKPLVRDRSISATLVEKPPAERQCLTSQPTAEEISQLEAYWDACVVVDPFDFAAMEGALPEATTKTTFADINEHFATFSRLLQIERDCIQRELEHQTSKDVSVRWSATSKNTIQMLIAAVELRTALSVGEEVVVSHSATEWLASGRVTGTGSFGKEICVEFAANESAPFHATSEFTVMPGWNATGFERMRKALEEFADAEQALGRYLLRRLLGHCLDDICFLPEEPLQPLGLPEMNREQRWAVRYALQRLLALVQGPPGTGKTLTAAAIVYNLAMTHAEPILVCAPSNMAVDQLAGRIAATSLKVVRVCAKAREDISTPVAHLALHNLVKGYLEANGVDSNLNDPKRMRVLRAHAERQILKTADVVACTCVSAADKRLHGLTFAATLIDECAQATEPECLIPIVRGARHVILVGDHRQLGPVVTSQTAAGKGLSMSLFERLASGHIAPYLLRAQYRMHPELSWFPSSMFYDGKLTNSVSVEERAFQPTTWAFASTPTFFWTTNGMDERPYAQKSYSNRMEALNVKDLVNGLLGAGVRPDALGVITPYDGQRDCVLKLMYNSKAFSRKTYDAIEVANVDAFQGREKEVVIISCVRANAMGNVGFLTDARRLNVALTRARRALYIIGDHKTLGKHYPWDILLQSYKEDGLIYAGVFPDLHQLQF